MSPKAEAICGCIIGTAIGDALGLPYEGLTPDRGRRLFKSPENYHLLLRHGMVSDDTEHTCMVAQALIASGGQLDLFIREFARRLRCWLLGLPAGVGFATLRSILKLWIGFSPQKSGIYSAGNGPAMRTAIIGVCYGDDETRLKALVKAATQITHTDPKAYWGALAVALAAHENCRTGTVVDAGHYYDRLENLLDSEEAGDLLDLIKQVVESVARGQRTREYVETQKLPKGITGYTYHTVPAVIHAWLSNPGDFRKAMLEIIECGGDTDTTAAILGGIVGAAVGPAGIPDKWLNRLWEWPRTIRWMRRLGQQLDTVLESGSAQTPLRLPLLGTLLRNLVFTGIVLFHGFRRLLPPY